MRIKLMLWMIVLLILVTAVNAVTTIYPQDDTYAYEADPAGDFGSETTINLRYKTAGEEKIALEFNKTGYGTIGTSNLTFYVQSNADNTAAYHVNFTYCNNSFDESALNWNNWDATLTDCNESSFYSETWDSYTAGVYKTIDTSQAMKEASDVFTIIIFVNGTKDGTVRRSFFDSYESATANRRPYMNFTQTAAVQNYFSIILTDDWNGSRVGDYNLTIDSISYLSGVQTDDTDLIGYWTFEDDLKDFSGQGNDGTNSGGAFNASGRMGYSYSFTNSNDYITLGSTTDYDFAYDQDFSASAWIRPEILAKNNIFSNQLRASPYEGWSFIIDATGNLLVTVLSASGGADTFQLQADAALTNTYSWYHVAFIKNGTNDGAIYVNGSQVAATKVYTTLTTTPAYAGDPNIGNKQNGNNGDGYFVGLIDEVRVYNKSLTPTEIIALYQSSNSRTDRDKAGRYNTSFLSTHTELIDITVTPENYFLRSFYNYNISDSGHLSAGVHQAEVCVNASSKVTNGTINGILFDIEGIQQTCYNISQGNYTVYTVGDVWFNKSKTISILPLENKTETITDVYSSHAIIKAVYANGTLISNSDLNVSYESFFETSNTINGSHHFRLINGTYQATINSIEGTETFNFTVDERNENVTFYYFSMDNCVNLTQEFIRFNTLNESNDNVLSANLDVFFNITSPYLIGYKSFSFNFSGNGTYSVCIPQGSLSNFTAYAQADYYLSPDYDSKNYYLVNYDLSSTLQKIDLYLTPGTSQVELTVTDYNDEAVADAYIKVLSYDLGTNTYKTTEVVKTDSEGEAFAQLVLNTAWYAFLIEYNGVVVLQTIPTKITGTSRNFRVNLETDYFVRYDEVREISHALTFNNASSTFSFTFSDPSGNMQQGCLKLTRESINGKVELNTSCLQTSAGNILMTIPEATGANTYKATSYVLYSDGQTFTLNSTTNSYDTTYKKFGQEGIFLSLLVTIVLVLVGIWSPVVSIVLMMVALILVNIMGLFHLNWSYIMALIIIGGIAIYRTGRSE